MPDWKGACQNQRLAALRRRSLWIRTDGEVTVDGCTRLPLPHDLLIRHALVVVGRKRDGKCVWHEACSFLSKGSRSPGRFVLSIVALALCACWVVLQAPDKPWHGQMQEYERTLSALERYRLLAAEDDGALLPEIEKPVEPGDHYDGVPRLIRLLTLLGDLPADAVLGDPDSYGGALVTAVQRFQTRHGLEPDGRIDKTTRAQLNTPLG